MAKRISIDKILLTEEQKKNIELMFFGPYLDEWRDSKGLVDNSDEAIANRLGLARATVSGYITRVLNQREKIIAFQREQDKYLNEFGGYLSKIHLIK